MIEHLKRLGCDESSTIEDIKKQYRTLSKKYHPDLSGSNTADLFIQITQSYEYLLTHHKPRDPFEIVDRKVDNTRPTILYRVLNKPPYKVEIDKDTPRNKDINIHFMLGMHEFRLRIEPHIPLPGMMRIFNVKDEPIYIKIDLV